MTAAARIGDPITCGDVIAAGSGTVFVNGMPLTRVGDSTAGHPCGPATTMANGSPSVFANGVAVCRVGDSIVSHGTCDSPPHTGSVANGSPDVYINS